MASVEQWRPIPGFSNYAASSLGRIFSWPKPPYHLRIDRIMRTHEHRQGYRNITLRDDTCRCIKTTVHRLVAAAFFGPCPKGKEVNHKNSIKCDNRIVNLEYITPQENRGLR